MAIVTAAQSIPEDAKEEDTVDKAELEELVRLVIAAMKAAGKLA